jgi:hypothetical protein
MSLERWVGLHDGVADRLVHLVMSTERGEHSEDVSGSDEHLSWALFSVVRGVKRFRRDLPAATWAAVREWAARLLKKPLSAEHAYRWGAFTAAVHLAWTAVEDDASRNSIVENALACMPKTAQPSRWSGPAHEGGLGLWLALLHAGADRSRLELIDAAKQLWEAMDSEWEATLKFVENNPHHAWAYVSFLRSLLAEEGVAPLPLPLVRERLLLLVQAAPMRLSLCAEELDPALWADQWPALVDLIYRYTAGADTGDPVAARLGAADLYFNWTSAHLRAPAELPPDLGFLLDAALLGIHDESPAVANHAAYAIAAHAAFARAPFDVRRLAGGLRRLAIDPRVQVRGAAAYAGAQLPQMNVADELRDVALRIHADLAADPYAVIHRQRVFGELDGRVPPL